MDKRILRTKADLSKSLLALILEKGYEKVTVQHILDHAGVGRATFYAHYENKEQLFLDGHRNLGIDLFGEEKGLDLLFLFRHAGGNYRLAKAILGKKSGDMVFGHFQARLSKAIQEQYGRGHAKDRTSKMWLVYRADAAAQAILGLLRSWLDDGMPLTAEVMAKEGHRWLEGMMGSRYS